MILLMTSMIGLANAKLTPYTCTDNITFVFMGDRASLEDYRALQLYYNDHKDTDIFGIPTPFFYFVCGYLVGRTL